MKRVLIIHNSYQEYGGEDSVFESEASLMRDGGFDVHTLRVNNDHIIGISAKIKTSLLAPYNPYGRLTVKNAIRSVQPDVVHVHNFFPSLSPSIFDACAEAKVPAVWTLHNFRIACVNGFLFRNGSPCEDCLGKTPLSGVLHRCYRSSFSGSLAVASMIAYHQIARTWKTKVARFVALTEFSKLKIEAAGVPANLISVKPNFVLDPLTTYGCSSRRYGALFVGRLSEEKGVEILLDAWKDVDYPLTIIGDGPLMAALKARASSNVTFRGRVSRSEIFQSMLKSDFVVIPSIWYENFPVTAVEALASGTPVIASNLGAMPEIIRHGSEGLLFLAGSASSLTATIRVALESPNELLRMGRLARIRYENKYSPGQNLGTLTKIYDQVDRAAPTKVGEL